MSEDKETFRKSMRGFIDYLEAEVMRDETILKIIEIIRDPPVYSIPFLGDPSKHVQGYRKEMDSWYCSLLSQVRKLEESPP